MSKIKILVLRIMFKYYDFRQDRVRSPIKWCKIWLKRERIYLRIYELGGDDDE